MSRRGGAEASSVRQLRQARRVGATQSATSISPMCPGSAEQLRHAEGPAWWAVSPQRHSHQQHHLHVESVSDAVRRRILSTHGTVTASASEQQAGASAPPLSRGGTPSPTRAALSRSSASRATCCAFGSLSPAPASWQCRGHATRCRRGVPRPRAGGASTSTARWLYRRPFRAALQTHPHNQGGAAAGPAVRAQPWRR